MNGKDIFSPFSLTACHHLAASVPPLQAPAVGAIPRHPSSDFLPLVGWWDVGTVNVSCSAPPPAKQANKPLGREGRNISLSFFFLFLFSSSEFGRALVCARASRNVGHSCRVMSALRSWHCCLPLSGGTGCSARETSANSRGERRQAVGCFVSLGVKTPHTPANSLYISDTATPPELPLAPRWCVSTDCVTQ